MSFSNTFTYRVTQLPDLDCTEYHARYGDSPDDKLFEMQDGFLHTVSAISRHYPLCCSLIYSYDPSQLVNDERLKIFIRLIFETTLPRAITQQIEKIFESSFWKDFYKVEKCSPLSARSLDWVKTIAFGLKQESCLSPTVQRKDSPSHYYTIQPFEPRDRVDRVGFLSRLEAYSAQAMVEIVFQPTQMSAREATAFENMLRALSDQSAYGIVASELSGNIRQKVIDPIANRTFKQFETFREDIQSQSLYELSIRVLAEDAFTASLLLNELWVESSEQPLYREIPVSSESDLFPAALLAVEQGHLCPEAIWTQYWHQLPENSPLLGLKRLHRLFTTDELSSCFRIVVPDSAVVFNGIPKETDLKTTQIEASILLGWQAGKLQNQARIPVQKLNKHVFICGVPGSGKTTAVLNFLFQLWTEHQIPFLVIEPAKTEYRAMLSCTYDHEAISLERSTEGIFLSQAYAEARDVQSAISAMDSDLRVYSLGNEQVCPFRFNPFAFYGTTTLDEHISTLESCFRAGMPLEGPMAALLSEGIEQAYSQHGWQPQDTADKGISCAYLFPTMQELYDAISEILAIKDYSAEISGNIKTALEVRIGGLLRRSVGNMVNVRDSMPSLAELLQNPTVLELDSLNEEQANLMTMFILASLREYAKVTRKSGSQLKHVVVIEEAHNIVGTDAQRSSEETANPKAEATKYIVRMLAEMRALGQGIIIADQLPSAVSPEVIKNTSTKLAHRTVSGDDRELLEQSMLLTSRQSEELARANPGDAYLFMEGTYKPVRVKEPNTKLIYGIEEPPSNSELVERIQSRSFYRQVMLAKQATRHQKSKHQNKIVQQQLSKLLTTYSQSRSSLDKIANLPIPASSDLDGLNTALGELDKGYRALLELPVELDAALDGIWLKVRQTGLYDDAVSDDSIIKGKTAVMQCRAEIISLQEKYEQRMQMLKSQICDVQRSQLQRTLKLTRNLFDSYTEKIGIVKDKIIHSESNELIVQSYREVTALRTRFNAAESSFDQLTIEPENWALARDIDIYLSKAGSKMEEEALQVETMYQQKYTASS